MKWIIGIICLLAITLSSSAFMATFEPGVANALGFRILYVVIGVAGAVGVSYTFRRGQER